MNDYKVGKSYEYLESKFIKEIFYHPISPSSSFCYLRAKCTPSQRLKDKNHTLWIAVCKETGTVKSAFCSCTAGMGQTCNHVAALMFRVESANKLGLSSCSSLSCNWKVPTATQVVPIRIKDLNVRKSRHGQVKSRSLVSSQKMRYRPEESMTINTVAFTDDMRKALLNACLFKGIDLPEESVPAVETKASVKTNHLPVLSADSKINIDSYVMDNIVKLEGVKTTKAFLDQQPILTSETVQAVQEKTIGQSGNSYWHRLRSGRITASNFYNVHTRVNSFKKNSDIDMSSSISTVLGITSPNPNIRALKFGRESDPVAKDIYCKQYASNHVNACFQVCGLFLDPNNSYLAASPDMVVSCDCCGSGLLEVKCTLKPKCDSCHSFCTCNLPNYISYTCNALEIRQNHIYFCPVQGQMAITQRQWCDFFEYSCNGTFLRRIAFQEHYYARVKDSLMFFLKTFIAPKLLERQRQY